MTNLEKYNKDMEEEFEKIAVYTNEYGYVHPIPRFEDIKSFIKSSHKSLLKKIAEEEVEMFKREINTLKKNTTINLEEQVLRVWFLQDQITHWKEIISKLD